MRRSRVAGSCRLTVGRAALPRRAVWVVVCVVIAGCITKDDAKKLVTDLQESQTSRPDVPPTMLTRDPIRYPASMYAQHAQGNVTLRIFIDAAGRVHAESTQVVESSGVPAFDSAAVSGVRDLQFTPAKRKGTPVAVSVLFPVYFRHPQGSPVPGDTVLHRGDNPASAPRGAAGDSSGR